MIKIKNYVLLIIISLLSLSLISCDKKEITSYDDLNEVYYKDVFSISSKTFNGEYYVIIHRPNCAVCEGIEPTVVKYAQLAQSDKTIRPIFHLNKGDKDHNDGISGDEDHYLNVNNYSELKTSSSPFLLLFKNGTIVAGWDGRTIILEELNKYL